MQSGHWATAAEIAEESALERSMHNLIDPQLGILRILIFIFIYLSIFLHHPTRSDASVLRLYSCIVLQVWYFHAYSVLCINGVDDFPTGSNASH